MNEWICVLFNNHLHDFLKLEIKFWKVCSHLVTKIKCEHMWMCDEIDDRNVSTMLTMQLMWAPCSQCMPLLPLLFGIAFHLQLVLLSYHPIFLRPYHFLKLVSFLGANRTKSGCWGSLYKYLNTIQYNAANVSTLLTMQLMWASFHNASVMVL